MTPFELSLQSDLHVEWQKFASDWLFKWHGMTYEGGVTDVDDFKGGCIHYSGIRFEKQQQQVFWDAVRLYLRQTVHKIFKRWDEETKTYPDHIRGGALEFTDRHLEQFVDTIVKLGVDTDRKLRSVGLPEVVSLYDASSVEDGTKYEIDRLARAHRELMWELQNKPRREPLFFQIGKWIEDFYANRKGLIWLGGLIAAAIGAGWRYFYG